MKKKYKLKKKFIVLLIILFIFIPLIVSTIRIVKHKNANKKITNILKETIKENNTNEENVTNIVKELKNMNKDFVGVLSIPDTIINYPVMYTEGEDYYLRRSFDKKQSDAGTLFIDKHNNIDPIDDNIIIYGHNMKNGTMFHELLNYKKENYYKKHKYIYILIKLMIVKNMK